MRSVLAASDDCIKIIDLDGRLVFMSEGGQRVMEVEDFSKLAGCNWPDMWTGGGNDHARAAIAAAQAGRSYRFQEIANTAKGNSRHWDVQVSPIIGRDGRPESILSVSRDITALKDSEERHKLLAAELNHRIKNLLTLVQAIVGQTLRAGGDAARAFHAQISERLVALAKAQDSLMKTTSAEADLDALARSVLMPHGLEERVRVEGPPVRLADRAAMAFALAVHELATNATKYGALSTESGRVEITWRFEDGLLRFEWRESGGPPVSPPTRRGFGSHVIERALSGYLSGEAKIDYRPEGVVVTLAAPVCALLAGN
ncbi:PAS domain S-box-containing protein [Methylopila capsulata]|uniref:Blue-light-activated histidine kinase n=1 Tax=Methylopila capsulata TaxID=61654 RepID=A0A9W6MQP3_9HYPH|nr:PAS domain-containing sensor histidine kinase [Methylopila capsulata]MBM7851816.1 PAS domain S-box-containing protein [Methylopila capsulata]GLK54880.1 sensor histidine kinase [Methylopila capsulata]